MFATSRSNQIHAESGEHPSHSDSAEELTAILAVWDAERTNAAFDPMPTLQRFEIEVID